MGSPIVLERALWSTNFRAARARRLEGVSNGEPFSVVACSAKAPHDRRRGHDSDEVSVVRLDSLRHGVGEVVKKHGVIQTAPGDW